MSDKETTVVVESQLANDHVWSDPAAYFVKNGFVTLNSNRQYVTSVCFADSEDVDYYMGESDYGEFEFHRCEGVTFHLTPSDAVKLGRILIAQGEAALESQP